MGFSNSHDKALPAPASLGLSRLFEKAPKKRFVVFVLLIILGFATSYLTLRRGMELNPESFRDLILSLGITGPIAYTALFFARPFFLIPSIALFIAGGLAFGPIWGPVYASVGAAVGGSLAFFWARKMGHDYVVGKLKLGAGVIENTRFRFSVVFLLSLIPVMPVTVINYGSGLSHMTFRSYILAHVLGLTPRAFAYGFFGSALMEIGSPKFRVALIGLFVLTAVTIFFRLRAKRLQKKTAR